MGELGVDANSQLVAYDQGNGAHAARLWWLARWIGMRNVAVLDGGYAAWRAAGLPLEQTLPAPAPEVDGGIARFRCLGEQQRLSMNCAGAPETCSWMRAGLSALPVATRRSIRSPATFPARETIHFSPISVPTENSCLPAELRARFSTLLGSVPALH